MESEGTNRKAKRVKHRFTLVLKRVRVSHCEGYEIEGKYGADLIGHELGRRILGSKAPMTGKFRVKCHAEIERVKND